MKETANPARERILERIKTALRTPAPRPAIREARPIFSPIENRLERFKKECEINGTECLMVPDQEHGSVAVAEILASLPEGPAFLQDTPAFRRLASSFPADRQIVWSSAGRAPETSQAAITIAEALVAQTGSILVSSACGGRAGSIVAPVHIVMAEINQLLTDLDAALGQARASGAVAANSFLCLTTGSSRTGDIEKVLVKGAHGPRRLIVVLSLQG